MAIYKITSSKAAMNKYGVGPKIGEPQWEKYNSFETEDDFDHAQLMMKDSIRAFVTEFIGDTFSFDHRFATCNGIYDITEDDVAAIVESIHVEGTIGGEKKKGTYREVYNIPEITGANKDAVMAHLTYNMVSGDLQKGFINKDITMYLAKKSDARRFEEMEYSILEPALPEVEEAKKAVDEADTIPRPDRKLGPITGIFGKLMSSIGMNFGWGKTYREDEARITRWNELTALPKERELLRKYQEAGTHADNIVRAVEKANESTPKARNIIEVDENYEAEYEEMINKQESKDNRQVIIIDMDDLVQKNSKKNIENGNNINMINDEPAMDNGKKVSKITMYARRMEMLEKKKAPVLG